MSERIVVNPITRISGFMEIEAMVDNHKVVDAKVKGLMFRGFEMMLKGRHPLDAIYYTERICGICSTAHGLASTRALEKALGVTAGEQARYIRDFMHGCEFLRTTSGISTSLPYRITSDCRRNAAPFLRYRLPICGYRRKRTI